MSDKPENPEENDPKGSDKKRDDQWDENTQNNDFEYEGDPSQLEDFDDMDFGEDFEDFEDFESYDDVDPENPSSESGEHQFDEENAIDADFSEVDETEKADDGISDPSGWDMDGGLSDEGQDVGQDSGPEDEFEGFDEFDTDEFGEEKSGTSDSDQKKKTMLYGGIAAGVLILGAGAYFLLFAGGGTSSNQGAGLGMSAPSQTARQQAAPQTQTGQPPEPQTGNAQAQNATATNNNTGSGQRLSDILRSGQLEGGNNESLLSNLDRLDEIQSRSAAPADPNETRLARERTLPVFEEAPAMGALPMPTPIENSEDTVGLNQQTTPPTQKAGETLQAQPQEQPQERQQEQSNDPFAQMRAQSESEVPAQNTQPQASREVARDLNRIEQEAQRRAAEQSTAQETRQDNARRQAQRQAFAGSPVNADVAALVQQLETNLNRFENQTQSFVSKLETIERKLSQMPDAQDMTALSEKVARLERRIDNSSASTSQASRSEPSQTVRQRTPERQARASVAPRQPIAPPRSKPQTNVSNYTQASYDGLPISNLWQLRAASQGKAWITRRGQNDFVQIGLGEQIDGVGRIQSIAQQGNRWVVTGSRARIVQ